MPSKYACINNEVYDLQLLQDHVPSSKSFDMPKPESKPKKVYIPPMNHPWRLTSFNKNVAASTNCFDIAFRCSIYCAIISIS